MISYTICFSKINANHLGFTCTICISCYLYMIFFYVHFIFFFFGENEKPSFCTRAYRFKPLSYQKQPQDSSHSSAETFYHKSASSQQTAPFKTSSFCQKEQQVRLSVRFATIFLYPSSVYDLLCVCLFAYMWCRNAFPALK